MRPVCQSLDILQSESKAYLGSLLSALAMTTKKLRDLKSSNNIAVCLPLLDVLNEALEKRFGKYFDDEYYLLAASCIRNLSYRGCHGILMSPPKLK